MNRVEDKAVRPTATKSSVLCSCGSPMDMCLGTIVPSGRRWLFYTCDTCARSTVALPIPDEGIPPTSGGRS